MSSILIINVTSKNNCEIQKRLFGEETISEENIWHIKNKYYEAKVRLVFGSIDTLCENSDVSAIVLYIDDPKIKIDLRDLEEKSVQLIVIESRSRIHSELLDWIDSGKSFWELVDFSEETDEEHNISRRIPEALQTHSWPKSPYLQSNETVIEESLETFEELLHKLSNFKIKADSLSHEERKAYAQELVLSLWDGLRDDSSEITSDTE